MYVPGQTGYIAIFFFYNQDTGVNMSDQIKELEMEIEALKSDKIRKLEMELEALKSDKIRKLEMENLALRKQIRRLKEDKKEYHSTGAKKAEAQGFLTYNNVTHHCLNLRRAYKGNATITIELPRYWIGNDGRSPNRPQKMVIGIANDSQCIDIKVDSVHSDWKTVGQEPQLRMRTKHIQLG
tara:strand:- start:217 stop:762 length:546 start_codon:yes stop_codon:yes gene_type:complete